MKLIKYYYYFILIVFSIISISISISIKSKTELNKAKKGEDEISDKELDELLKDPKYASLAGDLVPLSSSSSPSSLSPSPDPSEKMPAKSHYMSSSYKDHLERTKKNKSLDKDDFGGLDLLSSKSLSVDPLKELDLLGSSSSPKKEEKKKDPKVSEAEDKFKNFDFLTKSQARLLIEVLKQPVFMNMLPSEAQQIVKVFFYLIFSQQMTIFLLK
jgi:hypothetical protein